MGFCNAQTVSLFVPIFCNSRFCTCWSDPCHCMDTLCLNCAAAKVQVLNLLAYRNFKFLFYTKAFALFVCHWWPTILACPTTTALFFSTLAHVPFQQCSTWRVRNELWKTNDVDETVATIVLWSKCNTVSYVCKLTWNRMASTLPRGPFAT